MQAWKHLTLIILMVMLGHMYHWYLSHYQYANSPTPLLSSSNPTVPSVYYESLPGKTWNNEKVIQMCIKFQETLFCRVL
jgi:hypothetical protein